MSATFSFLISILMTRRVVPPGTVVMVVGFTRAGRTLGVAPCGYRRFDRAFIGVLKREIRIIHLVERYNVRRHPSSLAANNRCRVSGHGSAELGVRIECEPALPADDLDRRAQMEQ